MKFFKSTIGKKIIVAVTGLLLIGFVVAHMLGNLQVFLGPEKINDYAAFLKKEPLVLWGARCVLLTAVFLHILCTVQLARRNRQSRALRYEKYEPTRASIASRTMIWGGLFLVLFIVFHLLHLTAGSAHPEFSHTDVYANIISGFSVWPVSLFYILGMFCLGMHLFHGIFSLFQTLGLNHPVINLWKSRLALAAAVAIPAGYMSIPLAVMLGILR